MPISPSPLLEIPSLANDLDRIEARLIDLLRQEKGNWTEMAELALRVQSQKLYRQRGLRSFGYPLKPGQLVNWIL